jgi:hypothetical protein
VSQPVLAHVHIAKAGGSTVRHLLRGSFGIRHCDVRTFDRSPFDARHFAQMRRAYPFGLRSISGHALVQVGARLGDAVLPFTFVRDPVARVASAYQHHVRSTRRQKRGNPVSPLEDFVTWPQSRNRQVRQIAGCDDLAEALRELEGYLFVGLLERFEESLQLLAALSPYPLAAGYEVRNEAPDETEKQEILRDPARRKLIEEANASDVALYAHVRNVLYPAQRGRAARARESGERARVLVRAPGPRTSAFRARVSRLYNQIFYRGLLLHPQRSRVRRGEKRPWPGERPC